MTRSLPGIELNDQLFFNRQGDIFSCGQGLDQALLAFHIKGKPMRQVLFLRLLQRFFKGRLFRLPWVWRNHIAFLYNKGRNINPLPIDQKMIVPDQLSGGIAGFSETHAKNDIVQSGLKFLQQVFTGDAFFPIGRGKINSELFFQYAVKPFDLLLFSQLYTVFGKFLSALPMLTGKVGPSVDGTFGRLAPGRLQV